MRTFGGDFELKILRGLPSGFLDNQPENCCMSVGSVTRKACMLICCDVSVSVHVSQ